MIRRGVLLSILLCVAAGCGSSPTAPGLDTGGLRGCSGSGLTGTFTATVDGTAFTPTCLDSLTLASGIVSFGATNVTQSNLQTYTDIAIVIVGTGPGTFQLANKTTSNALLSIGGSQLWQAGAASTGTGTVVITTLTATRVAGTFTLNLAAGANATGTRAVTNGTFDLTL